MWRDSLRIGVDLIDMQHEALFEKVKELIKNVQDNAAAHREECIDAILFLKRYAVMHFTDEEKYQLSVNCKNYDTHKKLHETFVKTVLSHEKTMMESDFAEKDVKGFTGMLTAWLLYHVADVDQKIGKSQNNQSFEKTDGHIKKIFLGARHVLSQVVGLDENAIKLVEDHHEDFEDAIAIEIDFTGDISGHITMVYPLEVIRKMTLSMMDFLPDVIDELEISSLFEISTTICDALCRQLSEEEGLNCGIDIPFMKKRSSLPHEERIALDTGIGIIEVDVYMDYKKSTTN